MYYINIHGRNTPVLLPMLRTQPDWLFRAMAACWLPSNTHTHTHIQKKKQPMTEKIIKSGGKKWVKRWKKKCESPPHLLSGAREEVQGFKPYLLALLLFRSWS